LNIYLCSPKSDQAEVILNLIKKHQPETNIYGVLFDHEKPFYSRHIKKFIRIEDLEIKDKLLIPTGARSTQYFLERQDTRIGAVTLTTNALKVYDKPWILDQATSCSIPVPKTWLTVNEIEAFPVFYKQRHEEGGGTRGLAKAIEDIPIDNRQNLIFQEYIDSPGTYGVGFLAEKGEIIAISTHFEELSLPITGGSAVTITPFNDDRLERYSREIIRKLNYSGWGLVEFKYCPNRQNFVFMEVNAKLWASCQLAFDTEPKFSELLFDIKQPAITRERILFLNRYLRNGFKFCLANKKFLYSSKITIYRGFLKSLVVFLIPKSLFSLIHQTKR